MDNHPSKNESANVSRMMSLSEMAKKMENRPPQKFIYSGIQENTVGFVFGPSKSGKTTFCENLGMSIAAGETSFLGKPIDITNRKVLCISLEEFFDGRSKRNLKQAEVLNAKHGTSWHANYFVADEEMVKYVSSNKDWDYIENEIATYKPGIVIIDSVSRLHGNSAIEDSQVGQLVMRKLREIANKHKVAIVAVHHTPKMNPSTPLTMNTVAGSRILGQDVDFLIGINKTADKKTYIKDVAFRYASDNEENVTVVSIDENQWLQKVKMEKETRLLQAFDGRRTRTSKEKILDYMVEEAESSGNNIIETNQLLTALVDTSIISKQTLYNNLNSLEEEGIIVKESQGQYKIAA